MARRWVVAVKPPDDHPGAVRVSGAYLRRDIAQGVVEQVRTACEALEDVADESTGFAYLIELEKLGHEGRAMMAMTIDCGEGKHDLCIGWATQTYLFPQRDGERFECACPCHFQRTASPRARTPVVLIHAAHCGAHFGSVSCTCGAVFSDPANAEGRAPHSATGPPADSPPSEHDQFVWVVEELASAEAQVEALTEALRAYDEVVGLRGARPDDPALNRATRLSRAAFARLHDSTSIPQASTDVDEDTGPPAEETT